MGKKKKRKLENKPYCWYCTRDFDDEKILIQHQKAKHFKCHICHKKLTTAGGMVIHVYQVHKENITKVPNAKPGRDSIVYEIYGMEGIPDENGIIPNENNPVDPSSLTNINPPVGTTPNQNQPGIPITPPSLLTQPILGGPPPPILGMPPPPWVSQGLPPWGMNQMAGPPLMNPSLGPPPSNPLFPIHNSPGIPQMTSPSFRPPPITPIISPIGHPPPVMPINVGQFHLVYDDENNSMEEKRAELERYRYDEERIKEQVSKMNSSIESRLSSMKGLVMS